MKKECIAEFDYVAYHYVIPFIRRWYSKISHMRKGKNEKNYVFDKFISEFIIYSALVNVIKPLEIVLIVLKLCQCLLLKGWKMILLYNYQNL